MNFFKFLICIIILWASLNCSEVFSFDKENSIYYKLAILHTKHINPDHVFSGKAVNPSSATINEFKWIMESLKQRCINPENAIADTIYETWIILSRKGHDLTLLDVARELKKVAFNTNIFGNKKVNFRMTSKYWLSQKLK